MMTKTPRFRRSAFAAALLAASALTGVAGWQVAPAFAQAGAMPAVTQTAPIDVGRPAAQALPGFADLVQKVHPAVVTISTTSRQQQSDEQGGSPFPPGSSQDRMFGQFFGQKGGREGRGEGQTRTVHALGSGFIVDAQGFIVTNNHVVKDATDIQVTLADGTKLQAKLVGADARTDLAVLQVRSSTPLPHLALGDSDAARVGDWVVAVGNPFGLGGTVTAGILSARGREIGEGPYDDFLQIDAPINRGNSGGPLFAQDGTVIGVNTAIFSPSGGSIGIGFAIPSNLVKSVVAQLETTGRVERGWLGVAAQGVSPTMATALHLPSATGALVSDVQPNSPAARAGVQAGDVITALGTHTVRDPRDLARVVADLRPGASTPVTVRRDGKDQTLTAAIAQLQDKGQGTQQAEADHGPRLGLGLAALDAQARDELNLPAETRGVVVANVREDSPAQEAGLRAGDLLQAVGNKPVASPQEALTALREAQKGGGAVALRVLRDGQAAFVALRLPGAANQG